MIKKQNPNYKYLIELSSFIFVAIHKNTMFWYTRYFIVSMLIM